MAKEDFDRMAATWDENPMRREISLAVGQAIRSKIRLHGGMNVLDYGCGTGLLSFLLAAEVGAVTSADTSDGMLEQVRRKVIAQKVKNVQALQLDVTRGDVLTDRFDLITSAMTMHHIEDVHGTLRSLAGMLEPGGWLVVADLCTEDGGFHKDVDVAHHGFDAGELTEYLKNCGLQEVAWEMVHKVEKNGREYPIFCVYGRKKPAPKSL